ELEVIIHVIRTMVRPEPVLDWILDEVEPGNTSVVERNVVRAPGIPVPHRHDAEVLKRPQYLREYRDRLGVPLIPYAADLPGAVIQVEIRRDLRRQLRMLLDPSPRSVDPFLFATPQSDADRAPWVQVERLEDAHRFHHYNCAGGVVGRAVCVMP